MGVADHLCTKKGDSLLFYVAYWIIETGTVWECYPIQRKDRCNDSLGAAEVFSTLDATSGYWLIALNKAYMNKTSFGTSNIYCIIMMYCIVILRIEICCFKPKPLCLGATLVRFQTAIRATLALSKKQHALMYLKMSPFSSKIPTSIFVTLNLYCNCYGIL